MRVPRSIQRTSSSLLTSKNIVLAALLTIIVLCLLNLGRYVTTDSNLEKRESDNNNNLATSTTTTALHHPQQEEGHLNVKAQNSEDEQTSHARRERVTGRLRRATPVPDRVEDAKKSEEENEPRQQQNFQADSTAAPLFTLVSLTYKAPASLQYALDSFYEGGIFSMPELKEVLIYFQAMEEKKDRAMVERWYTDFEKRERDQLAERDGSEGRVSLRPIRVIGSSNNYPVAKATIIAIRAVTTPYVLYLECDRPVYPFPTLTLTQRRERVGKTLRKSLNTLQQKHADLVRLQLYAGPSVRERGRILTSKKKDGDQDDEKEIQILNPSIYGSNTHKNCLRAPAMVNKECSNGVVAKKKYGNVFNTAYCKHWKKFANDLSLPQQDLCDSFCFLDWNALYHQQPLLGAEGGELLQGDKKAAGEDANFDVGSSNKRPKKASMAKPLQLEHDMKEPASSSSSPSDPGPSFCLTSENCNWTNQPTMYSKAWWLQAIAAPCEANPSKCLGAPGRGSAVRQEIYFVKNSTAWAKQKYKICLSEGLFFHHEVDNRE